MANQAITANETLTGAAASTIVKSINSRTVRDADAIHTIKVGSGTVSTTTGSDSKKELNLLNVHFGQGYGTCTTAEATAAKVASLSNYALVTGGLVSIKFTNGVPDNATLNVNSKGAKNIKYKGANIVAGIIKAGDTATFMYDGTNYNLVAMDVPKIDNHKIVSELPDVATADNGTIYFVEQEDSEGGSAGGHILTDTIPTIDEAKDGVIYFVDDGVDPGETYGEYLKRKIEAVEDTVDTKLSLSGGELTGNVYTHAYEDDGSNYAVLACESNTTKGTTPSGDTWHTLALAKDSSNDVGNAHKYGQVETAVRSSGELYTAVTTYENVAGSTNSVQLQIGYRANGDKFLSYDGKEIVDYITDSGVSTDGNLWYRKWKSGWLEQGGIIPKATAANKTITFVKHFADTNYSIVKNLPSTSTSGLGACYENCANLAIDKFTTYCHASFVGSWYACGVGEEE